MPSSPFLFVEVSHTGKVVHDKHVRTAIQKHVMRDIAAERRRRHWKKAENREFPNKDQAALRSSGVVLLPRLVPGGGRMNPFAQYPVPMGPDTLFLIDYVYTCPHASLRPFRDTWLPISSSDPALFYEILSHVSREIAALHTSSRHGEQSLRLHARALQLLNARLSDPVLRVSDGVIGAILAFACLGHSAKDWKSYDTHMEGLLAIIRFKGGVQSLDHNRILRLLLSGIDVAVSCFNNIPLKFPLPLQAISDLRESSKEIPWWMPVDRAGVANIWQLTFPSDEILSDIFKDIATTVMTIKLEADRRLLWQDTSFVKDYVNPLTYRLLVSSHEMEDIDSSNFINECCRLSSLILLSKIRRKFETRVVFTGMETGKLRKLLECYYEDWTLFKPMLLWVLVIGALEVKEEEERTWLCGMIRHTAREIGLASWDEIVVVVSNLLWVGDVLDSECEALKAFVSMTISSASHDNEYMITKERC